MIKSTKVLIAICVCFVVAILLALTIFVFRRKNKNRLEKELNRLETLKNLIISSGLLTEIDKVKSLINNKKLEEKFARWEKRYNNIEKSSIPKITDLLLDAAGLIEERKYKDANNLLCKAELEIYKVKTDAQLMLEEIKEITLSAERNRNAVTKLKTLYREVVNKYNNNLKDYKGMEKSIDLQFDNINKLLSAFEIVMEKNDYEEVGKIVHSLDQAIKNIKIVIDETPTVILLGKMVIPKKIKDLEKEAGKMKRDNFNIEFMSLDYNIDEANKKIEDIFDRLKMLNLEDSIFELKTMLNYFEGLFVDLEKEKQAKSEYETLLNTIGKKITRLSSVVKNIFEEVEDLKETYALSEEELKSLADINKELINVKSSYKNINDRTLTRITPYSRLNKDTELISVKLSKVEDKLENVIKNLGSLKEDELRAREQLSEIRTILKESKNKIKNYKLPIIPKNYFVELEEAKEAIGEITIELEKKPIVINTLNTRVDTARDLTLKIYNLSSELSKTAKMAEMAIVYGNRYRSSYEEVDSGLKKAEKQFFNGEYRNSLELSILTLEQVDSGIQNKLLNELDNK